MLQIDPLKLFVASALSVVAIIAAASCSSFTGSEDTPPATPEAGASDTDGAAPSVDAASSSADAGQGPDPGTNCTDTTTVVLGNSQSVAGTDTTGQKTFDAYRFRTGATATVRCVHIYVDSIDANAGSVPGDPFEVGIYDDQSNHAHNLKATAHLTLPQGSTPALVSGSLDKSIELQAATTYWIAVGGVPAFSVEVDKDAKCTQGSIPDGPNVFELPDPFPNAASYPTCNLRAFFN